jgi:hypothetical protein
MGASRNDNADGDMAKSHASRAGDHKGFAADFVDDTYRWNGSADIDKS